MVDSYSGSSPSTASMHPYTVALIVLGIIALFIVLALVVFAFLTNTFCFATRGEPREERGGKVRSYFVIVRRMKYSVVEY